MDKACLKNKTVLITGASSGIGRSAAIALAHYGANLVLVSRNIEKLRGVETEVKGFDIRTLALACDISNRTDVHSTIQRAIEEFESIDIMICCAGMYYRRLAMDQSIDEIRAVMETNFFGTLNCVYEILPHFREEKKGHIVVISSLDGKKGLPIDSAYSASKFALTGFMETMRQELYGTSIHVSTVFPGRIDTPMIENISMPKGSPKVSPDLVAKAIIKAIILKKREVLVPYFSSKLYVLINSMSPTLGDWLVRFLKLEGEDTVL